jgi:hypothetical protein
VFHDEPKEAEPQHFTPSLLADTNFIGANLWHDVEMGAAVKPVGKLDVRHGHVQFDERGRETIGGL